MQPIKFIVECMACSQPWEVDEVMTASPTVSVIAIPEHRMLNFQTSEPMPVACFGNQQTGIGLGRRDDWERNWPLRKGSRPLPAVLDGTAVRYIRLR